jgi:hypothetical protein
MEESKMILKCRQCEKPLDLKRGNLILTVMTNQGKRFTVRYCSARCLVLHVHGPS